MSVETAVAAIGDDPLMAELLELIHDLQLVGRTRPMVSRLELQTYRETYPGTSASDALAGLVRFKRYMELHSTSFKSPHPIRFDPVPQYVIESEFAHPINSAHDLSAYDFSRAIARLRSHGLVGQIAHGVARFIEYLRADGCCVSMTIRSDHRWLDVAIARPIDEVIDDERQHKGKIVSFLRLDSLGPHFAIMPAGLEVVRQLAVELGELEQDYLQVLWEKNAVDAARRLKAEQIVRLAEGNDADYNNRKKHFVMLVTRGLCECAKKGPLSGYWLTQRGYRIASKLQP